MFGGLAQLARAPALQAGGQRFESVILHIIIWDHWHIGKQQSETQTRRDIVKELFMMLQMEIKHTDPMMLSHE